MSHLNLSIIAKDELVYQGEAGAIMVPTTTGIIEVLGEHMQLVSALAPGAIVVGEKKFEISGGVIEVRPHSEVIILADLVKK